MWKHPAASGYSAYPPDPDHRYPMWPNHPTAVRTRTAGRCPVATEHRPTGRGKPSPKKQIDKSMAGQLDLQIPQDQTGRHPRNRRKSGRQLWTGTSELVSREHPAKKNQVSPVDHILVIGGCCEVADEPTNHSQLEGSFGNFRKSAEHVNSNSPNTGIGYRRRALFGRGVRIRSAIFAGTAPGAAISEDIVTRRSRLRSLQFHWDWAIIREERFLHFFPHPGRNNGYRQSHHGSRIHG